MMAARIRTARMVGDRIRAADFDELHRMNSDPAVMATLGGVRSEEQTREFMAAALEHWERHGFGIWTFRAIADGSFVGRAGLRHVEVGGGHEIELLYAVCAEFWRRGFATEMADALVALGFRTLGQRSLVAFTLPDNRGSRRVMEKSGFRFERDIEWAGAPHVLYRINARPK
jgi:RimJ/RimL family protein N-acetyltransferase